MGQGTCPRVPYSQGEKDFHITIEEIIKYVGSNDWRALVLLAIAFEQSGRLIQLKKLEIFSNSLAENLGGFYFREVGSDCLSILVSWKNGVLIQVNSFNEPIVTYKLFMVFALVIKLLERSMENEIKTYEEKEMEIWLYSFSDYEKHIEEIPETCKDLPGIFMMRKGYNIMLPVIICDSYEDLTDQELHPGNNIFVSVIAPLYCHLYGQLTHSDPHEETIRKKAIQFVRSILGIQDESIWLEGSRISIDLGSVQQCLKKLSQR